MSLFKHISRKSALLIGVGLTVALASGLFESESLAYPDGTWVHYCAAIASKLFTIAVILIVFGGLQTHRSATSDRLKRLEEELSQLRKEQKPA